MTSGNWCRWLAMLVMVCAGGIGTQVNAQYGSPYNYAEEFEDGDYRQYFEEEEWYDPSDWFDGDNYEVNDDYYEDAYGFNTDTGDYYGDWYEWGYGDDYVGNPYYANRPYYGSDYPYYGNEYYEYDYDYDDEFGLDYWGPDLNEYPHYFTDDWYDDNSLFNDWY